MSSLFFENFPEIQYKLNTGRIVTIKDFFRKAKIEQNALNNVIQYTYYELEEGERPDVVATKLYGNPDLHWTLFLVNNFTSYQDWYKSSSTFQNYVHEKYRGYTLVANSISDIITPESKFLLGERIRSESGCDGYVIGVEPQHKRIHVDQISKQFEPNEVVTGVYSGKSFTVKQVVETHDAVEYYTNGTLRSTIPQEGYTPVSYYDIEVEENERKRRIKVIRPEKIKAVVSEFERIMSN